MKISEQLMDGFVPNPDDNGNIKFKILNYLRYWYLYVLGLILFVGLGYVYILKTTPEYATSTTILVNAVPSNTHNQMGGSDFSQNAVYTDLEGYQPAKTVENEAEILKSKSLMKRALEELNFNVSYFTDENYFRKKEIFGKQSPVVVELIEYDTLAFSNPDLATKFTIIPQSEDGFILENEKETQTMYEYGEEITMPFGIFTVNKSENNPFASPVYIKFNNPYSLPNSYSSRVDVFIVNKLASIIEISITDPVPQKGILVLNKLLEIYNKDALKSKNQTAANTLEFVENQLNNVTSDIREIEEKIENFKKVNRITEISSDAQKYSENSNQYKNQLAEYAIQYDVLISIEEYLIEQQDDYQAVPSSHSIDDQTLLNLINEFNDIQKQRERLLRTNQPNHPLVVDLNDQLKSLRRGILENIKNIKKSVDIAQRNLMARATDLDVQSDKVPAIERQLLEISRQQSIKQEQYQYLVQKKEEAELSLAATTVSSSRIIDPALPGDTPVKPNKILVLAFSVFFGLFIPIGFVYGKTKFDNKIKLKKQVSSRTNIPILGEISKKNNKDFINITESVKTPVAEQFRLIRTNIQFALPNTLTKTILVTSSKSGEGKTFFSMNLAISFALTQKKVIVLEFDLRKPALLDGLKIDQGLGISEYLSDDNISLQDIITKHKDLPETLDIVGCGDIPENPAELILSAKVDFFMEQLKERYDIIIIDTAPVGQIADAYSLSRYADLTSYILRYNYSSLEMVEFLNENYQERKLKNPMIVLNDAKVNMSYGYDYYQKTVKGSKKPKRKTNVVKV
ncbi:GumC family protein [Pleomorphovibrio marinus]|uniref:GumC family protein n=1 Tax=Pleomorphovibrio marinus TaxID=2164132 RepID=UPI000E0A79A8|nr:tyrosine-protein kinase family protein [Pleomorphovibrio marinus]